MARCRRTRDTEVTVGHTCFRLDVRQIARGDRRPQRGAGVLLDDADARARPNAASMCRCDHLTALLYMSQVVVSAFPLNGVPVSKPEPGCFPASWAKSPLTL